MSNTEFSVPDKDIYMYIFVKQNYLGRGGTGYKYYAFDFDFYIHLILNIFIYTLCFVLFGSRETESTLQGRGGAEGG